MTNGKGAGDGSPPAAAAGNADVGAADERDEWAREHRKPLDRVDREKKCKDVWERWAKSRVTNRAWISFPELAEQYTRKCERAAGRTNGRLCRCVS